MIKLAFTVLCFALPWALAWNSQLADVELFFHDSQAVFAGRVPYLHVPIEYPPLGTALFLMPRLLSGSDPARYAVLFVMFMACCDTLQKWLLWQRLSAHRSVFLLLHTVATCLLYYVYLKRFDPVASLCVTLACLRLERDPGGLAPWTWLAAGAGIKIFPVVLVPIFWRYAQQTGVPALRRLGQVAWAAGAMALPQLAVLGFAGGAGLYWFVYNHDRGLHVASTYAAFDLLRFGLGHAWPVWYDYGSLQVHTPWADAEAVWAPRITAALLATVLLAFWNSRREVLLWTGGAAMILTMVIGNKAFSPQYAGWLISMGVMAGCIYIRASRLQVDALGLALLLLGCACTAQLEPGEYLLGQGDVCRQTYLLLRTAALLALWGTWLLQGVRSRREHTPLCRP